jgi:xylulokinase
MGNKEQYILAHDLGTSGNKATLYGVDGTLRCSVVCDYPTYTPQDRFVEQDPMDWWGAVCRGTRELLEKAKAAPEEVLCVSFSGQMMGCLPVDAQGNPLRRSIIWADTRAVTQEKEMIDRVGQAHGYRITGHRLSASYSAAKLMWVRENEPEVYRRTAKMLHAKDFIIRKLTGCFVTDYSDASGTNLLDIEKRAWSQEMLTALEISESLLPEVRRSCDAAGGVTAEAARETGLLEGTPVIIGGGDGSCACVGAGVVRPGRAYNVLGSSSWISLAAEKPLFDEKMRTFNWLHLDETLYTPCGTMQAAGYSYAWFRDQLGQMEKQEAARDGGSAYERLNRLAEGSAPGANGVLFLPYLLGERSPRWDLDARGAFLGMGAGTTRGDLARAVLEGVGYNLRIIREILAGAVPMEKLVMIGGGAKGRTWMHILADIWQTELTLPRYREEATSMGAAVCGGVGIGLYPDYSVIERMNPDEDVIRPNPENAKAYDAAFELFNDAYDALEPLYKKMSVRREGGRAS